jgi:hypothetical protein
MRFMSLGSWRAQTRLWFPSGLRRFAMCFLRPLGSFIGVFQGLLGELVPGQVILFTIVRDGSTVCVWGEFVEFGSSLVGVVWHAVSLSSTHLRIISFSKLSHKGQDHADRAASGG